MGRISPVLTYQEFINKAKKGVEKTGVVTIACGNSLYLRIFGINRNTYWYYRDEKNNFKKFGEFPKLSLSMAREKLRDILLGTEDTKEEQHMILPVFGTVATEWLKTKSNNVRFANVRKSVDYLKPLFDCTFKELTIPRIKEAILNQNITPYKIQEVLSALINIMDLAVENEIIESHNCNVLKKSSSFPKHVKGPGYKWQPVNNFNLLFSRLKNIPVMMQRYYLLLALLCIRPGECRQLEFSFMNRKDRCIEIPGNIMKVKKNEPFRIPLTKQIEKLWINIKLSSSSDEYLFPRVRSNTPIVERDVAGPFTMNAGDLAQPHGFRKSARTFFAENGINYETAAMCLDHKINLGADNAYQKGDLLELRREPMKRWNDAVEKNLPGFMKDLLR